MAAVQWITVALQAYAAGLAAAQREMEAEARKIVKKSGEDLRDGWKANAAASSGRHGKHYPKSIKSRPSGLTALIEPDAGMPQGGMSFEFGSANQPPHLDGEKAMQVEEPRFESALSKAAEAILGR